jgi:hypothetical protein
MFASPVWLLTLSSLGKVVRLRIRCSSSGTRRSCHKKDIDPADLRTGKTKRCKCSARVNIRFLPSGMYSFTSLDLTHNHPAPLADNLPAYKPPSQQQKEMVQELSSIKTLARREIHTLLAARFPEHPLTLRQVTNLLNEAKRKSRTQTNISGDINAVVEKLMQLKEANHRWVVHVQINETTRQFEKLFWMSPQQVELGERFSDVVINDITLMRNKYNLPLNLWVVIDQFFGTRNLAYAYLDGEMADDHVWAGPSARYYQLTWDA